MQADLGDLPGDGLQRLVEPVDVTGRRARLGISLDSCFQHVNIVPEIAWDSLQHFRALAPVTADLSHDPEIVNPRTVFELVHAGGRIQARIGGSGFCRF